MRSKDKQNNSNKSKRKENNLALKIIPELKRFEARLGISGSFIKTNQIFDKKKAIDKPSKIKRLVIHKYKNSFFGSEAIKLLLLELLQLELLGANNSEVSLQKN